MYAKRTLVHWLRKQLNTEKVRAAIKYILVRPDHKHFVAVLKLVLPLGVVDAVQSADGWTLKLNEPEESTTEAEVTNEN